MNRGATVLVVVVLMVLVMVAAYFSMGDAPAVIEPSVLNGNGGGAVAITWGTQEHPSGYVGNTALGYPQVMDLTQCKAATGLIPATVGFTYNTTRSQCYPKMVMDPSKRKRYSDVVGYRKL